MPEYLADLNAEQHPDAFASRHWLHTSLGNGQEMIMFSGNALTSIRGTSEWRRGIVRLILPMGPAIPEDKYFCPDNWILVMNPTSMWDKDQAVNCGFAVDTFRMVAPSPDHPYNEVELLADAAVRDSDAFLYRISYHLTMVGTFVSF